VDNGRGVKGWAIDGSARPVKKWVVNARYGAWKKKIKQALRLCGYGGGERKGVHYRYKGFKCSYWFHKEQLGNTNSSRAEKNTKIERDVVVFVGVGWWFQKIKGWVAWQSSRQEGKGRE